MDELQAQFPLMNLIKADITAIKDDAGKFKLGQEQTIAMVELLLVRIGELQGHVRDNSPIDQWLRSIASCAGSVSDESDWWEEDGCLEEPEEIVCQDKITSVHEEETIILNGQDSDNGEGPSSLLRGRQHSLLSFSENQTRTDHSTGLSFQSSISALSAATDSCQSETAANAYREQQPTFASEEPEAITQIPQVPVPQQSINLSQTTLTPKENRTRPPIPYQLPSTSQSQSMNDTQNGFTLLDSESSNPDVTATIPLDSQETRDTQNSKEKPRTKIPLKSGKWIFMEALETGKSGRVKKVKHEASDTTVSQLANCCNY